MEENHSLAEMRSGMPYLNGLATGYAYASGYKAVTHPSEPNYLAIAGGSTFGDSADHNPAFQVTGASVFGQALSTGRTAGVYAESMTGNCQQSNSGTYVVKHNPWASFASERTACDRFDVPAGSPQSGALRSAIVAGTLPNVGLLVPNVCNDAHDCSLATADTWLSAWMSTIMAGPDFSSGRLAVVITGDEDDSSAGNTVLTTVVARQLDSAHLVVTNSLNHYSLSGLLDRVAGAPLLRGATAGFVSSFGIRIA